MPRGRDGVCFIRAHQLMANGRYVGQLQNHVARQFALHVEVEVIDIRHGVVLGIRAEVELGVGRPVQRTTDRRVRVRKGIALGLASSHIGERVSEGGGTAKVRRAKRLLKAGRVAKILQLALFRVAIPIHAETAADDKIVGALGANQFGWARTRRPGEAKAWAKVIVF
jgi:hypothetical protein